MARAKSTYDVDPGRGYVLFAGTMLALVGCINMIYGIGAIADSNFYVADIKYVFGDLHTWGWIVTIAGALQIAASFGVFMETEWGRWLGIIAASVNILVEFLAITSHPFISIMAFFVDITIIWGLLTYGGRDRYSLAG